MTGGAWVPYTAADGKTTRWYLRTKPWTVFANGTARAYGCVAIKRELLSLGYTATGFRTDSPVIGDVADEVIKHFQTAQGLVIDGIVGPNTTENLFAGRISGQESKNGVPNRWAARIVKLESSEDPGAIGYVDFNDKGLAQINVVSRPVTVEQAFDPAFAAMYLAGDLAGAHASLKDWEGAVASWNVGSYWAVKWVAAGKPTSGAWDDRNQLDWFTRASHYVELVGSVALKF